VIDKVHFVDDEPAVLEGYKRLLGRAVPADTADSNRDIFFG
jgi:hypothetical protein